MNNEYESKIEDVLKEIEKTVERMRKAKLTDNKAEYEAALEEHDRLHKKYEHILYKKREPTQVYTRKE